MAIESGIGEYSNGINKGWALKVNVSSVDGEFGRSPRATSAMAASLLEQAKDKAVRLLNRPWHKRQVIWNEDEWDILEHHSEAYDTQALMISCGTVTIDAPESSERKVLLIWNKNTKAWQLPKGRKNVHEDFSEAALRETAEETGVAVQPLYMRFCTRLTLPERTEDETAMQLRRHRSGSRADNGMINLLNKDIFCISQYPDPATGAMRHIYWYAARPLRTATPNPNLLGRDDSAVMTAHWFPAAEAVSRLKMSVERRAVALAVHYAEQMTEEEWKYSLEL